LRRQRILSSVLKDMGSARSSNRGGTGRGVPTKLPPAAVSGPKQLTLAIAAGCFRELLPGVVHISGWLNLDNQRALVEDFRQWAAPPAGLRRPAMPTGHLMSVQSVCLGWHWRPYVYSRTADDTDGAPVKPLPAKVATLACAAVDAAYGPGTADATRFKPDAAIVNLYSPDAHLGLHQDGEEPSDAPVVTISLGDACVFRMASVERRSVPRECAA